MKRYVPFLAASFFLVIFPLNAEKIKPFVMPSARASGFGGIHAAQGDDFSSIFSNPASFAGIKKQFSAAELTMSFYGPVFDILDKAVGESGNVSSLVDTADFAAGVDIGGPIALGLVNNGFGIGFFNRTVMDIVTVPAPAPASPGWFLLKPEAGEEILLIGGYSFRVLDNAEHSLDIGILGKGFYRAMVCLEANPDKLYELISNAFNMPMYTHFGMGIDLGIKYSFDDTLTLALVGYDVFSPALVTKYDKLSDYSDSSGTQSYGYVKPRLALGVLYRIRNDFLERYITDFVVMADYRDFINLFEKDRRHPLLNVTFGAEITMLRIFKLRAGMADALPSGGFGIDMKYMTLDLAIRGKQLGDKPGEKTVFAFDIGLLFRY